MSFPLIQLSHVSKTFGSKLILDDISLTINSHDRLFLIGENGSGKSTLANIILGREPVDSGQIVKKRGLNIAYLPQELPTLENFASDGKKQQQEIYRLIQQEADLLLLDEPTNHVDWQHVQMLERWLRAYRGALLIISHDRSFINRQASSIVELSSHTHTLSFYGGNYDFYLQKKKEQLRARLREYEEQKTRKKEFEGFIKQSNFSAPKPKGPKDANIMAYDKHGEKFLAGKAKKVRQARSRLAELEEKPLVHPHAKELPTFTFHPKELGSDVAIRLCDISKGFEGRHLFAHVDLEVQKDARLAIVGPNGSGKSTLLKIIAKELQPDSGTLHYTPSAQIAYLDQNLESLTAGSIYRLLETQCGLEGCKIGKELARFGLPVHDTFVSTLSVGQKKRLQLLMLLHSQANIFLLDEPTNHLDLLLLEKLEEALVAFQGVIIACTHDERFIETLGMTTFSLINRLF